MTLILHTHATILLRFVAPKIYKRNNCYFIQFQLFHSDPIAFLFQNIFDKHQ